MKLNVEKIIKRLEELGWTRYRLAQELDVCHQTVYRTLSNPQSITLSTVSKYATVLDLPIQDIIV